jgi:hypothetical protein
MRLPLTRLARRPLLHRHRAARPRARRRPRRRRRRSRAAARRPSARWAGAPQPRCRRTRGPSPGRRATRAGRRAARALARIRACGPGAVQRCGAGLGRAQGGRGAGCAVLQGKERSPAPRGCSALPGCAPEPPAPPPPPCAPAAQRPVLHAAPWPRGPSRGAVPRALAAARPQPPRIHGGRRRPRLAQPHAQALQVGAPQEEAARELRRGRRGRAELPLTAPPLWQGLCVHSLATPPALCPGPPVRP